MGCSDSNQILKVSQDAEKELSLLIELAQKKCKQWRKNKVESIKKKDNDIYITLKQRNLDSAKSKMASLLQDEDHIAAIDIINSTLDNLKNKTTSMLESKECPIGLRPPLDSILYASSKISLEELKKLREKITQIYGPDYVLKAINNDDKIVNQDLIQKLSNAPISEETVKQRLIKFINQKKAQKASIAALTNSLQKSNVSNGNNGNNSTSVQASKNNKNSIKQKKDDPFGKTVLSTIQQPKSGDNSRQNQPTNDNMNNNNNAGSIPINMLNQLMGDYNPLDGKTTETVYASNDPNKEQPQTKQNDYINILDEKTCQTMHISIANPDGKENPFEGDLKDINYSNKIPPSGRTADLDKEIGKKEGKNPFDKNAKIQDPFGGETLKIEEEEQKKTKKAMVSDDIKNIDNFNPEEMEDPFGGATLPMEEIPIKQNGAINPFDKNAKIADPFGGDTIPLEEEEDKPNGAVNPFDKNAKIEDPFGGETLKMEE